MQSEDIAEVSYEKLLGIQQDKADCSPTWYQIDPRTGQKILYCPARTRRPHDWDISSKKTRWVKDCPICSGDTTSIWDIAPLSRGYTFINENLFPAVFPLDIKPTADYQKAKSDLKPARGMHFLQWHSNYHHSDYDNMPVADIEVNLKRLAVFEKFLLLSPNSFAATHIIDGQEIRGHAAIIKNYGYRAGCSLSHGHLQIIHTDILPERTQRDIEFLQEHKTGFSTWMQVLCKHLLIKEYGQEVKAYVPFCMKRPLEAVFCLNKQGRDYVHQLVDSEIKALAQALQEVISALKILMLQQFNQELAYNILFHTGSIGGMYIELLPCTQRMGGYENLGLYLCHQTPDESAKMYRDTLVHSGRN